MSRAVFRQELDLKPLFTLFWQICRFRRGPQDVPFAPALAGLLLIAVAGLLGLSVMVLNGLAPAPTEDAPLLSAPLQLLVQWMALAVWMVVIYLLLHFKGMSARYVQVLIAALGTDLVMFVPQFAGFALLAQSTPDSPLAGIGQFAVLFVYIWDMLIKGHIYSQALNISRLQGNLLSLALSYAIFALSTLLIPTPT